MANETGAKGKWMGIDYGQARIGLAVSDPMGLFARGLETINWNGRDLTWGLARIETLINEHQVIGLVVGIPRRTDGKASESEDQARKLAAVLAERTGLPVVLRDERYTTVMASRIMRETGIRKERRKSVVDQIAAEIILQEYLESLRQAD
jgi:putative Holliday junction resolvase